MTLRQLFIVFVVGLLVRGTWGTTKLMRADDPTGLEFPDEQQYWLMASSLHSGLGLQDELGFRATRMPLYPAALSLLTGAAHGVVIAKVAQWIVGALGAALTAGLAGTLFDRRVGFVAGLLVALDPFLVFFSSLLLTETLFVAALCALWWMLAGDVRGAKRALSSWVLVGAVAALTVYCRESSLGLILMALGFVVLVRRFERRILAGATVATAVILVSLVPWAVRNHRLIGEWCWLTTRGGISLYDAVGPQATGVSDLGNIKRMPAVANMTEAEWNRYFLNESFKAIQSDPFRVLRLAGVKLSRTWNPFPNVETYRSPLVRGLSAGWTVPTFAAAVAGLALLLSARPLRRGTEATSGARCAKEQRHSVLRRRAGAVSQGSKGGVCIAVFLLLPALYFSLLHSVFIGSVRYRLGAIPMLAILAAFAVVAIADWIRGRPAALENTLAL